VKKFFSLVLTFCIGAFIGSFAGVPLQAGAAFVGMKMASAHFGVMPGALYTSIDVSAITDYGADYKKELIGRMINGMDIAKDIMVMPNIKGAKKLTKMVVANGFRPYSKTKEFKASQLVFSDRTVTTKTGKRELELDYRDFKDKYLALRSTPGNGANKDFNSMEFAPWVWDQVVKNLQREMNDETAYFGFDKEDAVAYDAGDAYAVGDYVTFAVGGVTEYFLCTATASAGDTPATDPDKWRNVTARAVTKGLKTYIDAGITAAELTEVTVGAIDTAAKAKAGFVKLFRSAIPAIKNHGVLFHASLTDCEYLLDSLEDLTKYIQFDTTGAVKAGLIPVPNTNGKAWVKPATWLGDSRRIIGTPVAPGQTFSENLVLGTDLLTDGNDIKTVVDLWTIQAGIALDLGFQYQDPEAIIINDQD
jgi:hypothetical protein